eukprot:TRINITY_DN742_c0_g1_i10.p2 TRINITY_DN742_c0_g1~~TRINITY_DN742_c0_g1_i10.p2  ORF type:complete len:106 (+),score=32.71 TRINITY_DN742_c0_g1_i10:138-455(+)
MSESERLLLCLQETLAYSTKKSDEIKQTMSQFTDKEASMQDPRFWQTVIGSMTEMTKAIAGIKDKYGFDTEGYEAAVAGNQSNPEIFKLLEEIQANSQKHMPTPT